MAAITKARQVILGVFNGTDTVFFDPTELNYNSEPISSTGLIRRQGSIVIDPTVSPPPESLDPDANPNGRWNEGNSITVAVGAENFNAPVTHPAINHAKIIEKPFWAEGVLLESIDIEIGDELSYLNYPVPVDDRSGIDIAGEGLSLTEVINNHLVAGCTTPLVNVGPTTVTRRTWQGIDRQSVIETAGEIAFGSDGGPWFIYQDENGDNRIFNYDDAIATPRFTLTEADLVSSPIRLRSQIKRFEKLVARSNIVTVNDCQYGTRVLQESYRTVADYEYFFMGAQRNNPVLELRITETKTFDEPNNTITTFTREDTTDRRGLVQVWSEYTDKTTNVVEVFNDDGFLESRVTSIRRALFLTSQGQGLTTDLKPSEGVSEFFIYDNDKHLIQINTTYSLPVYDSGSFFLQFLPGTTPVFVDVILLPVGRDVELYTKDACGWQRTISKQAVESSVDGQRILIRYESNKKAGSTHVNGPPAATTLPQPEVKEEPVEVEVELFPPHGPKNKATETDVTLRFVSSEQALQDCANWLARQMWQQSSTYRVALPYLDVVRDALASPSPPIFSFDVVRADGSILRLLWNAEEYIFDQGETYIELEAQLIAAINGGIVTTPYRAAIGVRAVALSGPATADMRLEVEPGNVVTEQDGTPITQQDETVLEENV